MTESSDVMWPGEAIVSTEWYGGTGLTISCPRERCDWSHTFSDEGIGVPYGGQVSLGALIQLAAVHQLDAHTARTPTCAVCRQPPGDDCEHFTAR